MFDDWTLTGAQLFFMLQHSNRIQAAFASDDLDDLRALAASDEFTSAFPDMGFDEAYDRYQTMLETD